MAFKAYYRLTKPGIIYGNAITLLAGSLLASKGDINLSLLLELLIGVSLVIASACVFNNYIDRDIDRRMTRTRRRALVSGLISPTNAIIYATFLGIVGFVSLTIFVNTLVVAIIATAFIFYVIIYGIAKRRSVYGTIVGSVPGAAPPVAGYCAVTNHLDSGALILFLILVFWQMPHFYTIAMYRFDDYKSAKLPVLPVKKGFFVTKIQILVYITAFIAATVSLSLYKYTGRAYLVVVGLVGVAWLGLGLKGFSAEDDKRWARKMFFFSLIVTLCFSIMVSLNSLLIKI